MIVRPLSRAEVRGIDIRAADEMGLPTLVLMENAGRGAAAALRLTRTLVAILLLASAMRPALTPAARPLAPGGRFTRRFTDLAAFARSNALHPGN